MLNILYFVIDKMKQEIVLNKIKNNSEFLGRVEEILDNLATEYGYCDWVMELFSKLLEFKEEQEELGIIYKRLIETNNA